jgi:hypothetical protein
LSSSATSEASSSLRWSTRSRTTVSSFDIVSSKHAARRDCVSENPKKPRIKYEIIDLEDKLTGDVEEFNLYREKSIPFLNPKNESSSLIRANIIDGDADDDCQTDDD